MIQSEKIIALIPARYNASRFPGKLLADLCGAPVIARTYQAVQNSGLFSSVIVVCDDLRLAQAIETIGGTVMLSKRPHESGSDRIAEAAENLQAEIIVNIQGDEPFTQSSCLEKLIELFKKDPQREIQVASLMKPLIDPVLINDPNYVKVVTDLKQNALLFSRAPIPYNLDDEPFTKNTQPYCFEHRGIYAFRKEALMQFTKLAISPLEKLEKIECLRFLYNGISIRMATTLASSIEIDTQEDLIKARELYKHQQKNKKE